MVEVASAARPASGLRVGIAVARFNEVITQRMLDGALQKLAENGVEDVRVTWVPGAFELPLACRMLAKEASCNAVVMLGAIVKGETDHYEYVCHGVTDGAMRVQLELDLPMGFGVLTCQTMELALARAGGSAGNKGADAADAALAMHRLRDRIGEL